MNQEKKITVRTQKIKKNHTKAKLIFFLTLAIILLLIAIFSKYLCPYEKNHLALRIHLEQTDMEEICFQG